MFAKFLLPCLLASVLAPAARASSDIEISFGRRTGFGEIGLHFSSGHGNSSHEREGRREWVPAHFEGRTERVWIEGREQQVWIAPVYDWRYDACGRPYRVQLQVGHWSCVRAAGHFESRPVQVWVGGRWEEQGG
jgi:hypothetical protein